MTAATKSEFSTRRGTMTNDEVWLHRDGLTGCPDCCSETVVVDVSEIVSDSSTLTNYPLEERGRCVVHAVYCPTCDEILATRLIDPVTGQSVVGRRIKPGSA
jgi:hypothetical protein